VKDDAKNEVGDQGRVLEDQEKLDAVDDNEVKEEVIGVESFYMFVSFQIPACGPGFYILEMNEKIIFQSDYAVVRSCQFGMLM